MTTNVVNEDVFNDELVIKDRKDPLEYTLADRLNGGIKEDLAALSIQTRSSAGIQLIRDLKRRVMEHVHVNSLRHSTTSLQHLNRIYGVVANKLGTNVRAVVDFLASKNRIVLLEEGKRYGYYSASVLEEYPVELKKLDKNAVYNRSEHQALLFSNMESFYL